MEEGTVRVIVKSHVYMSWELGDEGSKRMAIVQLYGNGAGTQEALAEAFGLHVNTVGKYILDYAREGFGGLIAQRRGPKGGWKLTAGMRRRILRLVLSEGLCGVDGIERELRERWGYEVSHSSVREVLLENGLMEEEPSVEDPVEQAELFETEQDAQLDLFVGVAEPGEEEWLCPGEFTRRLAGIGGGEDFAGEQNEEFDGGLNGSGPRIGRRHYSNAQRVFLDRLEEGEETAYAGGLLLSGLLHGYEFLPTLKRVIEIATHEGYSLEELCLSLLYLDLFGYQSIEDFKRAYREEFGLLIGRSLSPSIYTLRRFLHKVRKLEKAEELIGAFGCSYLKHGLAQWGVIYIDGHFLPYYGMNPITKGWHGVRQMPMKGSYNFLVVDEEFRPWVFLIRPSSEDLLEKIPELIEKARKVGSEAGLGEEELSRLIVLFDREGYSAELYRKLEGEEPAESKDRVIFISWAKYASKWVYELAEENFSRTAKVCYQIRKPEEVRYFETTRSMKKYGEIRTIVIESGKQNNRAAIYTNGKQSEIGAERIVQLMCRRWGEENQIKELLHRHKIDYMPGYVVEAMEEQPWVENPNRKELKKQRSELVGELRKAKVSFADEILKKAQDKTDGEIIKTESLLASEKVLSIENQILLLNQELERLPKQVRFNEAHDGRRLLRLNYEKKRFLDCIKVFGCNMRSEMCRMLLKYYDLPKEIQPVLSMILQRGGRVRLQAGTLHVRLRRFQNREINYAARHLCEDLNEMRPVTADRYRFPLHFEVS
jgi:transposase